jgi:hypothetical protein
MTKFTDNLWRDLAQEHGAALAHADRPEPRRTRRPSSRVIAGSTLVLAVGGTALGLGLTSTGGSTPAGGTKVVTAAYTITESSSGSVLVQINQGTSLPAANHKLTQMGIHEQVTIYNKPGAAAVSGPVTCTPAPGVPGPQLKVLLGTNGTEVIAPGTTGKNTGVGTWHVDHCYVTGDNVGGTGTGNTGNTGAG